MTPLNDHHMSLKSFLDLNYLPHIFIQHVNFSQLKITTRQWNENFNKLTLNKDCWKNSRMKEPEHLNFSIFIPLSSRNFKLAEVYMLNKYM